ncbi:MAG TPA: glycosyltransferase 87 family protein [Acidobacteriaceae bacterium]|nr:glycosyltransferase 87 family protein [Acidobacteriaceae bacterium]
MLTRQLVSEFDHFTIGFSAVAGWSIAAYLFSVAIVLTQRANRFTFVIILTVMIVCRLVTLFPDPYLSSDVYRYAWDGVVQHAHISPYRYVPGDPALSFLRAPNQDLFDNINRRDYAHTIYPPVAQILFYLITFINPTVVFMKTVMILFEGLTMYALVAFLREMGVVRERTILYAWCPLLIWEIGSSGHLDSAVMAFMALALLARYRKQPILTGLFLGLAVMTKMYPLVLFPALYRRGDYKMPATLVSVIASGYLAYCSVGLGVFGFLGGYVQEEGISRGTRYFLLELAQHVPGMHSLSTTTLLLFSAAIFITLIVWCWRNYCLFPSTELASVSIRTFGLPANAAFLVPAFCLALTLMLLFSPHYPWYIAWLMPFLVLVPNLTVLTYVCAFFYLCTTALAVGSGPLQFLLNKILYACILIAMVAEGAILQSKLKASQAKFPYKRSST